jgi:hypothetical protein
MNMEHIFNICCNHDVLLLSKFKQFHVIYVVLPSGLHNFWIILYNTQL